MATLILIVLIIVTQGLSAAVAVIPSFPVAKRYCSDRCGNISIPFPFGTMRNCYKEKSFLVTCNQTSHPPKLFMQHTNLEITDISLDGQLRVMQSIAKSCYGPNGKKILNIEAHVDLPQHLTVNSTANIFTARGCGSYSTIVLERDLSDGSNVMGCSATCRLNLTDDYIYSSEGSRRGTGCCQTLVPEDVSTVSLVSSRLRSRTDTWNSLHECVYAFLGEESGQDFCRVNLTVLRNVIEKLPMVVDWVIGYGKCEEAQACKSLNSECYKPNDGPGYRCRCKTGYEGSPYLVNGCQDVDECKRNICVNVHMCENTQGGFTCSCPKGYRGDGRINGTGCVGGVLSSSGESRKYKTVAGVAVGITAMLFVTCWAYVELKRRKSWRMKQKYFLQNGGVLLQERLARQEKSPVNVSIYSSSDLQKATNNFHSSMIAGQGGFGIVYKGLLTDNRIVAVKKSKEVDPDQIEQFINEVIILSQINHRNVVKLLGCCLETPTPLLVYEFINNGSLFEHIHRRPNKTHFLNWEVRLKIAIDTAGVLSYLHSATSIPIIHRDVKSANILLDQNFTAKVCDFGASRLVPLDQTQLSTLVQGTFGYLDPEYMQTNRLTEKSDVYSFGVFLVELLTGKKVLSFDRSEEQINLSNFFLSMLKEDRLLDILDNHIVCEGNKEQLTEVAGIAKACLNVSGEDRPSMKEVAMELEGLRLCGKHLWAQIEESGEETESLFRGEIHGFDTDYDYSYSTSVGFESLKDHII